MTTQTQTDTSKGNAAPPPAAGTGAPPPAADAKAAPPAADAKPGDAKPGTTTLLTEKAAETDAKKGEEKKPDEKPADEKKLEPVAVKWSDELGVPEASRDGFAKLAGELGLKSEGAQKIHDFYASAIAEQAKADESAFEAQQKKNVETIKADKEFGGANLTTTVENGKRAIAKYGGAELNQILDRTGLGNHPTIIKTFARIGAAMSEDSIEGGTPSSAGSPNAEEQALRARYPNSPQMFPKKE